MYRKYDSIELSLAHGITFCDSQLLGVSFLQQTLSLTVLYLPKLISISVILFHQYICLQV